MPELILPRPLPPRSRPITRASVRQVLALGTRSAAASVVARGLTLAPQARHLRRAAACVRALARRGKISEGASCR